MAYTSASTALASILRVALPIWCWVRTDVYTARIWRNQHKGDRCKWFKLWRENGD